jgi:hypothetical protein
MNKHRTAPQPRPKLEGAGKEGEASAGDVGRQPTSTRRQATKVIWRHVRKEWNGTSQQKPRRETEKEKPNEKAGSLCVPYSRDAACGERE